MEEVSRWGSEVCTAGTGWVSVVGKSGAVVVSAKETGRTVCFVVTGEPVETADVSGTFGGLEVMVVVFSVVGTAADQEVLSE